MSYKEFMDKYNDEHYMCPKCHTRHYDVTLCGYIYDENHPEEYKDLNHCKCYTCGWTGRVHDLIPKPQKLGYKVAYIINKGETQNYDDNIYTKNEVKDIVNKLERTDTNNFYYWYEIEIKD